MVSPVSRGAMAAVPTGSVPGRACGSAQVRVSTTEPVVDASMHARRAPSAHPVHDAQAGSDGFGGLGIAEHESVADGLHHVAVVPELGCHHHRQSLDQVDRGRITMSFRVPAEVLQVAK